LNNLLHRSNAIAALELLIPYTGHPAVLTMPALPSPAVAWGCRRCAVRFWQGWPVVDFQYPGQPVPADRAGKFSGEALFVKAILTHKEYDRGEWHKWNN